MKTDHIPTKCPIPIAEFMFGVRGAAIGCSTSTATIYSDLVTFRQNVLWGCRVKLRKEDRHFLFWWLFWLLLFCIVFFTIYQNSGMLDWDVRKVSLLSRICYFWKMVLYFNPGLTWGTLLPEKPSYPSSDMGFCRVRCEMTPQNASSDLFWCGVT